MPETQSMVLQYNMGTSWPSSTLSVAVPYGCIATVHTFTPEVAAHTTSIRVQLKTLTQASRSSGSCEALASTSIHDVKVAT